MLKIANFLSALVFLAAGGGWGQTPATGELDDLKRRAEEAFVADDLETAIDLYRRLSDGLEDPREKVGVLMTVASVQHLAGKSHDALLTLVDVLVLDPDYAFEPELYDERFQKLFYEAQKHSVTQRAHLAGKHTREGIDHLRRRDHAAARRSFEAALGFDPTHATALYNLAYTELKDGREDEAQAGFERLLALAGRPGGDVSNDLEVRALVNLGYLYSSRRQDSEAETALRRATELDGDNAGAWLNLGSVLRRQGEKDRAAEAFRKAYELNPGDANAASNLALVYLDARDWGRALIHLGDATSRHPDDPHLWLHLGRAHLGLGQGADAVPALEKAIRLDSENAAGTALPAAVQLASHYYEIGDFARAFQQAARALSWGPDNVEALIYQGLAHKGLGNLAEARRSLEEARRLDPARATTHSNLGSVYYELGLFEEAEGAFERALEIDPSFGDARRNLDILRNRRR